MPRPRYSAPSPPCSTRWIASSETTSSRKERREFAAADCALFFSLAWEELSPKTDPERFNPAAVIQRLKKLKRDPWEDFYKSKQAITKGMKQGIGMK
jgi:DNA primase